MNTSINLQGLNQSQLQDLQTQVNLAYFADDTTEQEQDLLNIIANTVRNCLPASFVLASLFDVEAMSLEIPDHVLEDDPLLEWITCPCCRGEKWLETNKNGWVGALFADTRRAYAHRYLNSSYKICGRCSGVGEVLDSPTPKYESYKKCSITTVTQPPECLRNLPKRLERTLHTCDVTARSLGNKEPISPEAVTSFNT
jgi:hypothetical protein